MLRHWLRLLQQGVQQRQQRADRVKRAENYQPVPFIHHRSGPIERLTGVRTDTDAGLSFPCQYCRHICGCGGPRNSGLIRQLRCPIICGGANNILDDYDEDGVALKACGIVYVPDFIANAGGVIGLVGAWLEMPDAERDQRLADIEQTTRQVLRDAANHPSTYAAAVALARRRIAEGVEARVTAE